jgi:uncharacterized membrane protein (UPF0127 family)
LNFRLLADLCPRKAEAAMRVRAVLAFVILLAFAVTPALTAPLQTLEIVNKSGVHVFEVEIADTEAAREKGLMFRKELPEGRGMLFDFHQEQDVAFWMQNTYIPLDMIFIKGDGRILRIEENTKPMSTKTIPSGGAVRAVLEVIAGTSEKLGLAPGDQVAGSIFKH